MELKGTQQLKYQKFHNIYINVRNDRIYNNQLKRYTELYRSFRHNIVKVLSNNINIYNTNIEKTQI